MQDGQVNMASGGTQSASGREEIGRELHAMAARLFGICRSMTGDGVRETLSLLREWAPFETVEVETGTQVFDWVVPPEWGVRDAFVKDESGKRVIDFRHSNLHLVNGSVPVRTSLTWSELKRHLQTLPEQPDRIPYRTAFFREKWGFCLTQNQFDELEAQGERTYDVLVDTTIEDGSLTYGECVLPGESAQEVLFSAHICHPSLANDNLSGLCIAALLARRLHAMPKRRLTYRFLLAPATIGALTWLAQNLEELDRIRHGLVLSLLGDAGPLTYKRSRRTNAPVDRAVAHVLATSGKPFEVRDFVPWGYDERQFCSPGIDLPMGCLTRTPAGEFKEYHTSGDDLDFIKADALTDSFRTCLEIIDVLENDIVFRNLRPMGEPRLGQHGLYESMPEDADVQEFQHAVQWVLNLSDGRHSLLGVAERSGMRFASLCQAAFRLEACDLIARVGSE